MVQPMFTVSAANVYGFQTYIQGTVCGGIGCLFIRLRLYFQRTVRVECSLFIKFLNISPGNYLPGCSLFIWFLILPPGNCLSGCRGLSTGSAAFFTCFEPTSRWLSAGVHRVFTVSKPTSKGLSLLCPSHFSFPSDQCAFLGWLITKPKQLGSLPLSLSHYLSLFLCLSLALSLAEHIASGQAQTRSLYISRLKFN